MEELQTILKFLLSFNEQLLGLPALPLIVIFGLAIGQIVKASRINNQYIPRIVVTACSLGYLLLCLSQIPENGRFVDDISIVSRYLILGCIGGAGSWIIHNKILKKYFQNDE